MPSQDFNNAAKAIVKAGSKVVAKSTSKAARKAIQNIDPLAALREYCKYRRATEEEITKREGIKAKRDIAVAALQAQRDIIETYFHQRFEERSKTLDHFFDVLSHAVNTKSETELDIALNGILGVINESPLKDFESFRAARIDGKVIEI